MIIDKTFDYLAPEERQRADKCAATIFSAYADKFKGTAVTVKALPPDMITQLANLWTDTNEADPENDPPTKEGAAGDYFNYLRRQASSRYISADRPAADYLADAIEFFEALTPDDLEISKAFSRVLAEASGAEYVPDIERDIAQLVNGAGLDALIIFEMHGGSRMEQAGYLARSKAISKLSSTLPAVKPIRPRDSLTVLAKLARQAVETVPDAFTFENAEMIAVKISNKPRALTDSLSVWYSNSDDVSITGKISEYEIAVLEAVGSLYDAGNKYQTDAQIYRTMTGSNADYISEAAQAEIDNAMRKLRYRGVAINMDSGPHATPLNYEGAMLPNDKVRGVFNGTPVNCYRIFLEPPLVSYAKDKSEIARTPVKLLDTPLRKDPETIGLQTYLKRRVLAMRGGADSNRILYQSIYDAIAPEQTSDGSAAAKNKKKKLRDKTGVILEYWKAAEFIKDFRELKERGKAGAKRGIEIDI